MLVAEEVRLGTGGDPGAAAELIFELAGRPPGVADEGTDDAAGPVRLGDGILRGNTDGPAEAGFLAPPEGGKSELVAGDRPAIVNGKLAERGEFLLVEEVTDDFTSGLVQDEAEGSLVRMVLGKQDDGAVEGAVAQRGVRQKQLALELDRGVGLGRVGGHVEMVTLPCQFANRGIQDFRGCGIKLAGGRGERQDARVIRIFLLGFLMLAIAGAEPLALRVVAANLTSDRFQSYSPDNANHSNPEGAGARILKALQPDIVLIQEFKTTIPARQWVKRTLGEKFSFMSEKGMQIPNGIISRFPIVASGSWDDPVLDNREFAWAQIRLPGGKDLWAVSVHLHSKTAESRARQAAALAKWIGKRVPKDALLLVGGDLNTRSTGEACFRELAQVVVIPKNPPADAFGDITTNAPRNRPYDWVLASAGLERLAVPVKLAEREFPHGLVFDSRSFEPLEKLAPVQKPDSGVPYMQHMAVVRDFQIP